MIGAIIGDIVGSRFEWDNHRSKDFELFTPKCFATDDSIMSLAIAEALMRAKPDFSDLGEQAVRCMQEVGRPYPDCGYGGHFLGWMYADDPQPYHSFGNGAAMRVSACGLAAKSVEEVKALSRAVTEVTHDHPEGLKGAEATAVAVYLAKSGAPMAEIRARVEEEYYSLDFTLDAIRDTYRFNETCQQTVPQALEAFFESVDFEDAIRQRHLHRRRQRYAGGHHRRRRRGVLRRARGAFAGGARLSGRAAAGHPRAIRGMAALAAPKERLHHSGVCAGGIWPPKTPPCCLWGGFLSFVHEHRGCNTNFLCCIKKKLG